MSGTLKEEEKAIQELYARLIDEMEEEEGDYCISKKWVSDLGKCKSIEDVKEKKVNKNIACEHSGLAVANRARVRPLTKEVSTTRFLCLLNVELGSNQTLFSRVN